MSATDPQLVLPASLFEKFAGWPYITVMRSGGHTCRAEAGSRFEWQFHWYTTWGYSELAWFRDEGVIWIRGWHDSGAAELVALLAAQHLVESAA